MAETQKATNGAQRFLDVPLLEFAPLGASGAHVRAEADGLSVDELYALANRLEGEVRARRDEIGGPVALGVFCQGVARLRLLARYPRKAP